MDIADKAQFLKTKVIQAFRTLNAEDHGKWGAMNAQQMVEHMAGAFRNMYGLDSTKVISNPDHLPKMRQFLMSEKPFREDTKNPGMPDAPPEVRFSGMDDAISDLSRAMDDMFAWFEAEQGRTLVNPIFGKLDYAANVQLLHKHVLHHMRQFGVD